MQDEYSEQEIARRKAELIGRRVPLEVYARIKGKSMRQVYYDVAKLGLSYIMCDGQRWLDPFEDVRRGGRKPPEPALEPPRRPGRPPRSQPAAAPVAPRRGVQR
jgi:hypothetical protein